jgi:thioredoxin-dependent peroxiredoxin
MSEIRKGATHLKGTPVDLVGPELKVGQVAPDFTAQANDMKMLSLSDFSSKIKIIASVPSLDTPVCDKEAKRFSEEVTKLSGVEMICISMDLPMAQKRWCGASGAENVQCLSDHQSGSFGENYGVLINSAPLKRFLARAVFVIGEDNKLKYVEYVKDISEEPNYDAVLAASK